MEIRKHNKALKTKKLSVFLEYAPETEENREIKAAMEMQPVFTKDRDLTGFVPGAAILIGGYPGLCGAVHLAKYHEEELAKQLPPHFLYQTIQRESDIKDYKEELGNIAQRMAGTNVYPLGEGGLYKALYQLGKDSNLGFRIRYHEVPVRQECIEICEFFDIDPWELFSAGSMLVVTTQPQRMIKEIPLLGATMNRVGSLTKDKDKLICHKESESRINRPQPDGLLRILQKKLAESEESKDKDGGLS